MTITTTTRTFTSPFTSDDEAVVYLQAKVFGGGLSNTDAEQSLIEAFFRRAKLRPDHRLMMHKLAATEKTRIGE
jgi:hypothetical protein